MKDKQRFTVSGSVALKKALVEELKAHGIEDYDIYYKNLLTPNVFDKKKQVVSVAEWFAKAKDITQRYTLPEQYNEAKQAFIDFYKEEPEFIEGRWYKLEDANFDVPMFFRHDGRIDRNKVYYSVALNFAGEWNTNDFCNPDEPVLATPEEIEKALSDYAVKQGYTHGVVLKEALSIAGSLKIGTTGHFHYCKDADSLWYCGACLYKAGKWAGIVKPEAKHDSYEFTWPEIKAADIITDENRKPTRVPGLHKVHVPEANKQLLLDKLKELQELIDKM